eukprot:245706-Chlamydomonas_euryale.AAC.2
MDEWMYVWMDGQMQGRTYGWMGGWMDGCVGGKGEHCIGEALGPGRCMSAGRHDQQRRFLNLMTAKCHRFKPASFRLPNASNDPNPHPSDCQTVHSCAVPALPTSSPARPNQLNPEP